MRINFDKLRSFLSRSVECKIMQINSTFKTFELLNGNTHFEFKLHHTVKMGQQLQ